MTPDKPDLDAGACLHISTTWVAAFNGALAHPEVATLDALFLSDCHLRSVLAFSWTLETYSGTSAVCEALRHISDDHKLGVITLNAQDLQPHCVQRAGEWTVECLLTFSTPVGPCEGVLRLCSDGSGQWKAWSLVLALIEIAGHEEAYRRPQDASASNNRSFQGPNWKDKRDARNRFEDREPEVLVVGAGQAGLSVGARLRQLGVDALVVDQNARLGDNWRNRYHALVLHNQRHVNHLPYMPFPETWPTYIPKDKLADWFAYYADAMDLAVWMGTRFVNADYDAADKRWCVTLETPTGEKTVRPAHIIMATGVSAIPNRKKLPELQPFEGPVIHSADYQTPDPEKFGSVVVMGTGTSAHDVAQDLAENGVKVTMVQRSPTMVQNVEPTAQLPYAIYGKALSTDVCDLLTVGTPMALYKASSRLSLKVAEELDKPLIEGLKKTDFKVNVGEDGVSWQLMYLTRGGGYYFNVGCSDLIINGQVRVVQSDQITSFEASGLTLASGEHIHADLVITATGYLGQREMAARLLGDALAERIGPVWDVNSDTQELNNMWMETPQPGLWFFAGSLAQSRIYSKYLGLQIQAKLLGLM